MGKAWSSPHAAGVAVVLAVLLALLAADGSRSMTPSLGPGEMLKAARSPSSRPGTTGTASPSTAGRCRTQSAAATGCAPTELRTSDGELSGRRLEAVFTRDPESGGLVYTDPGGPGLRMELVRASGATDLPSPWPTGGAQ